MGYSSMHYSFRYRLVDADGRLLETCDSLHMAKHQAARLAADLGEQVRILLWVGEYDQSFALYTASPPQRHPLPFQHPVQGGCG